MITNNPMLPGKTIITTTISRPPVMLDSLPVNTQQTFSIEVENFGLEHIKKALVDSEALTKMLQDHPNEMVAIVNDTFAGRSESAKSNAAKIGLSEEAFQNLGGGWVWCLMIGICAGAIFVLAATDDSQHHHNPPPPPPEHKHQ
ncbi:MAG: hypothetical protein ACKVQW_02220 [Pyrinomonadaceae bacterium]